MIPFLNRLFNNQASTMNSQDDDDELRVNINSASSSTDLSPQQPPQPQSQPTTEQRETEDTVPQRQEQIPQETENPNSEAQHPAPPVRLRPFIRVVMPIVLPQEFIDDNDVSQALSPQPGTRQLVTEIVFMLPSEPMFINDEQILNTLFNMQQPQGPPPATTEVIDSLKTITVTEKLIAEQPRCCICYDEFMCANTVTLLPCNHVFDKECIVTWLKLHNTCPVCRHSIKDEAGVEKMNGIPEVDTSTSIMESNIQPMNDILPADNNNNNNHQEEEMKQPEKNSSRPQLHDHLNGHCSDCTD
jgi:hypothetical protein